MRLLLAPAVLAVALGGCGGGGGGGGGDDTRSDFALSGTVHYGDRVYGQLEEASQYGFIRTESKPVRFARVQILNADGAVVGEAATDELGMYRLTASGGRRESMRLRVLAHTVAGTPVTVKDFSANVLAAAKAFTPGTLDGPLHVAVTGDLAGAFNMLDVYAAAGEFVHERHGSFPPALTVYWQPGTTPPGGTTYFCRFCPAGIFVLGGRYMGDAITGDSDHFDDDVLLHEYGHFLEHMFGVLDSPGGSHTLFDLSQDLRLAWSEGFSSFMAGAIKAWMTERRHATLSSQDLPVSSYLDTDDGSAGGGQGLYFDFDAIAPWLRHASNESAVAKVLWNLHGDGAGMDDIWEAFSHGMPLATTAYPASLETFWDGWQASELIASPMQETLAAFAERDVRYDNDAFELDDTFDARSVVLAKGQAEAHNLFKHQLAAETDLIPFEAVAGIAYRIETYDLVNGADTYLRIKDTAGNTLEENGNAALQPDANDGCALASRIDAFMPVRADRYYVEVTRPTVTYPWAGRYGGYRLKITELPTEAPMECP